ncbi:MAG: UDP-3-O-(3-hydroxymyristoyl)glucosamine N-acyltransferase [bacterium]|nr:UDP-3-O-(3-hydroxymyristoyl)glucosamine N-acyltransferase [bacterium]
MKLSKVAEIVEGRLFGDPDIEITGVAGLDEAEAGDITFATNGKKEAKASAILVKDGVNPSGLPYIIVQNPKLSFCKLLSEFARTNHPSGIHKLAVIGKAVLGKDVAIGAGSVIEDGARIGDKVIIYPNVYIGKDVSIDKGTIIYPQVVIKRARIGKGVIVHSGVVIGSDGFGYLQHNGENVKVPHQGNVVIEDEVEIGANTTIDCGTTGSTVIGAGTKIDNLVQIAHNCVIGKNCVIVAQVGISGSVQIGDNTIIAGQVGISDHIKIGKNVKIAARAVVTKNIGDGKVVSGFPAKDHQKEKRLIASINQLPELIKRVKGLENGEK